MNKFYIGIGGFARSGKDLCGQIIIDILKDCGKLPCRFAFADELKIDVEEFLNIKCNTSPYTTDTEEKNKIRPFLVWYATFQRQRNPNYWIEQTEKSIKLNDQCDIVVLTDVRYENETNWIHDKGGWVIHLSKYTNDVVPGKRIYQTSPNEEETRNDPFVKQNADYTLAWRQIIRGDNKISVDDLRKDMYLKEEVLKSIKSCPGLSPILRNPKNLL